MNSKLKVALWIVGGLAALLLWGVLATAVFGDNDTANLVSFIGGMVIGFVATLGVTGEVWT